MNEEKIIFLDMLSKCVNNQECVFNDQSKSVFDEFAPKHALLTFIGENLCRYNQPINDDLRIAIQTVVMSNYKKLLLQQNIINLLKMSKIKCAVLKGTSVAINYPQPVYRPLGDVDILVHNKDYLNAIKVLTQNEFEYADSQEHDFHFQFFKNNVSIEIHKSVTGYISKKYMKHISTIFDSALDSTHTCHIENISFPVLDTRYQAASLCLHMHRHFIDNELNLRMLCDWALFVKSVDDIMWNADVRQFLKKLNLEKFASGITTLCNEYLKINCENKEWYKFSLEFKEIMIDEFFYGIGANRISISQNIGQLSGRNHNNKIAGVFAAFNFVVKKKCKFTDKHPVLLPFAWFYVVFNYIIRCIFGKANKVNTLMINEHFDKRQFILSQLDIKEF